MTNRFKAGDKVSWRGLAAVVVAGETDIEGEIACRTLQTNRYIIVRLKDLKPVPVAHWKKHEEEE